MEVIGKPGKRRSKPAPIISSISEALELKDPVDGLWRNLVSTVFLDKHNPKLENLSRPCQALYLADLIDREIQNGGFDQFFYNTSGRFCDETKWALAELGAKSLLSLLNRACSVFPNGVVPKDDTDRRELLLSLPKAAEAVLGQLDGEFNFLIRSTQEQVNEPENPAFLALQYMKKHETARIASSPMPT